MSNIKFALIPSGYGEDTLYSFVGGDFTFSRGSNGTRINKDNYIEIVPTDYPRLNYPLVDGVVGSTPYLLLEEERKNYITYSEDFSNAAWNKTNVTIDTDAIIAPDGKLAYAMRETNANGAHQVYDAYFSFDGTSDYTYSVFAKAGGTRILNLFSGSSSIFAMNANFDLVNGVVDSVTSGTARIEKYPNGWYRCSVTGASASSGASNLYFRHVASSTSYVGDINEATYIWGAMLEKGSYPTSYFPNYDTTAGTTRNADLAVDALADFNPLEGVFFAEIEGFTDDIAVTNTISLTDGTAANSILIRYFNDDSLRVYNGGTSASNVVYVEDLKVSGKFKIAVKYGTTNADYKVYVNGFDKPLYGSFVATAITDLTKVKFTYSTTSAESYYGKVKQVLVYDTTDLEASTSWKTFAELAQYFEYNIV